TGPELLSSERRNGTENHGGLDARRVRAARVFTGLYTARDAPRFVEDLRPREFLFGEYVQADGVGRCRISAQADELSGTYSYLRRQTAQLSRSSGAARRTGHRLSLCAVGRDARTASRARL